MEARTTELSCIRSKSGDSLSQIGKLTRLTFDQVKNSFGQATGYTPKELSIIFCMKQAGISLEEISQKFGIDLEVLKYFLEPQEATEEIVGTEALADQGPYEISLEVSKRAYTLGSPEDCKTYRKSPPTTTEQTKEPHTFFYSCLWNWLFRVNLLTGEQSCHEVPNYEFRPSHRWSELPGGRLLITGGGFPSVREVEKIETLREYAVSSQPPMHTARSDHAAVYHSQHVYVLGGTGTSA
jgi:hypothetical protein